MATVLAPFGLTAKKGEGRPCLFGVGTISQPMVSHLMIVPLSVFSTISGHES
jgi:hypothetical protein